MYFVLVPVLLLKKLPLTPSGCLPVGHQLGLVGSLVRVALQRLHVSESVRERADVERCSNNSAAVQKAASAT